MVSKPLPMWTIEGHPSDYYFFNEECRLKDDTRRTFRDILIKFSYSIEFHHFVIHENLEERVHRENHRIDVISVSVICERTSILPCVGYFVLSSKSYCLLIKKVPRAVVIVAIRLQCSTKLGAMTY
jgi:hypothetical protein